LNLHHRYEIQTTARTVQDRNRLNGRLI